MIHDAGRITELRKIHSLPQVDIPKMFPEAFLDA
jgi:hypothetical protein